MHGAIHWICRGMVISLFALGALGEGASADRVVGVNPEVVRTASFDGWGCSLCWWANEFGQDASADTLADLCFTTRSVTWNQTALPGLGMNIVRYNVGGSGSATSASGAMREKISPQMASYKALRAFLASPGGNSAGSTGWDWEADAAQLSMLRKALARGADSVEFFSNTPPWWMCRNRSSSGSDDGGDNLDPGQLGAFCDYLTSVVGYARGTWKVPVAWVSPFNEPMARWWKFPQRQEGCHFSRPMQRQVLAALRLALDCQKLQSVGISASEENDFNTALGSWRDLGTSAQLAVAKVNAHGYSGTRPYRGDARSLLRQATGSKKTWMSEYGDADASGRTLAKAIFRDFTELRADGWVYWQPLDGGGWGLLESNVGRHMIGPANRKWYVYAQFTRHLRAGSQILESSDAESVVAYDRASRSVEAVIGNFGAAKWVTLDLSKFTPVKSVQAWATTMAAGGATPECRYSPVEVTVSGNRCRFLAEADSVTSLRFGETQSAARQRGSSASVR